ncbi:MAG TPA: HmuY family protein [Cyclobacteriaceae bacterium]
MSIRSIFVSVLFVGVISLLVSCSEDDPAPDSVVSTTISDLDADYAPFEPITGPPTGPPKRIGETKKYTLFSFSTGQIVPNSDSATTKWDIGFRSTSIIINSGTSGPGATRAQVVQGVFEEISEAPELGYIADNTPSFVIASSPKPSADAPANYWWQNGGSGSSTIVSPIPGQIIVIKTSENRYAKMEILSYYKGAPAAPNNMTDLDRHYTFRFVYQPNDSRKFE